MNDSTQMHSLLWEQLLNSNNKSVSFENCSLVKKMTEMGPVVTYSTEHK